MLKFPFTNSRSCILAITLILGATVSSPQDPDANVRGVKVISNPDVLTGETYALLIGISKYQTVSPLEFADKDAEMFAEFLARPRGGALPPDHIKLLTESQATRAGIDDAVHNFVDAHKGPQNKLILLIAGHGAYLHTEEDPKTHKPMQSDPYFLTWDSHISDAKTTGYPMAEFRNMIASKALDYGRVLVFADVCHAANIAGMAGGGELQDAVNRVWTRHEGGELGLLAASHADKLAIESRSFGGGHGAFSYFVVSGLNGAAVDSGVTNVKWNDLAHYVNDQVFKFTSKQQSPRDYSTNEEILVIPDLQKPGITLPEAHPLTSQDVRDVRSRQAYIPPIALQTPSMQTTTAIDSFDDALRRGVLLPEEPESASMALDEIRRRNSPPSAIEDLTRRLKIAFEDRGQQVMNRYRG